MDYFEILFHKKYGSSVPINGKFYETLFAIAGEWKETTIVGVPPIIFLAKGDPLSDYLIEGNTIQNGTPTPSDPVDVVGCGDPIIDASSFSNNYQLSPSTGLPSSYSGRICTLNPIDVSAFNSVTINFSISNVTGRPSLMYTLFRNGSFIDRQTGIEYGTDIDVTNADSMYICLYVGGRFITTDNVDFVRSSLGYKIPITCGGVTPPIYLGNVQTTRKIKKLVFDGNENWDYVPSSGVNRFRTRLLSNAALTEVTSTHFKYEFANAYGNVFINSTLIEITFCYNLSSVNDWKSYLAAQYSAGTPVTVWYVLATPETTTLNEPLHKIGDYADAITMAQASETIQTIAGSNTLSVGTTVQPSEVSITGNIKEVS